MKRQVLFVLLLVLFCAVPAFGRGVYISGSAGGTYLMDAEVNDTDAPNVELEFESEFGFAGTFAVGYAFTDYLRLEGEVSYMENDYDETTYNGVQMDLSGDINCLAFLVNGYYDFKNKSRFTPFITLGAGVAEVETAEFSVAGSGVAETSSTDTVFAYQVGAGVSYEITKKVALDCKYRFFGAADPEFTTVSTEYYSHQLLLGFRLNF